MEINDFGKFKILRFQNISLENIKGLYSKSSKIEAIISNGKDLFLILNSNLSKEEKERLEEIIF
jgi:hypothetical protein